MRQVKHEDDEKNRAYAWPGIAAKRTSSKPETAAEHDEQNNDD